MDISGGDRWTLDGLQSFGTLTVHGKGMNEIGVPYYNASKSDVVPSINLYDNPALQFINSHAFAAIPVWKTIRLSTNTKLEQLLCVQNLTSATGIDIEGNIKEYAPPSLLRPTTDIANRTLLTARQLPLPAVEISRLLQPPQPHGRPQLQRNRGEEAGGSPGFRTNEICMRIDKFRDDDTFSASSGKIGSR